MQGGVRSHLLRAGRWCDRLGEVGRSFVGPGGIRRSSRRFGWGWEALLEGWEGWEALPAG